MKAADFMELVLEAHVIAAANELMDSVNGGVMELVNGIVKRFVCIFPDEVLKPSDDNAYVYACEILSLGFVWWPSCYVHMEILAGDIQKDRT